MKVADAQAPQSISLRQSVLLLLPRLRFDLLLCLVLCLSSTYGAAQALSDMPTIERIKAEIKGSDPTDTLARQVAVCSYLIRYVDRVKSNRTASGPFTAEEQKLFDAYRLAAYQLQQEYEKTHTKAEVEAFGHLEGKYEFDSEFYKDWSSRLIGPQSAATYKQTERELGARQKAHIDAVNRANEEAKKAATAGPGGLSNDPTAVATRRCLELGGASVACLGKGLGAGLMGMIGFGAKTMDALTGSGVAGVVLSGLYKSPATTATLGFGPGNVTINGCGKLVSEGHGYVIEKRPGAPYRITVANEPAPIQLAQRPGGLVGPGPVDVKGSIIVGYHTVSHTLYVNGAPAAAQGYSCNGPCSTSESVPDYAPKIERCVIGGLQAPPPVRAAAPPPPSKAESEGLLGMLTSVIDTGEGAWPSIPGLRMSGSYEGRMLAEFTPASVVLDCGEAHARLPYTVEETADGFMVHVDNASGGPFNLAVAPDGSLRGAGSTAVNGRLVTGMQGDDVTFRPHSETCEVGVLRPKQGSGAVMKLAGSGGPVPSAAAASSPAAVGPAGAAPAAYAAAAAAGRGSIEDAAASAAPPSAGPVAAATTRAAMRVLITATLGGATNPMAGQAVYIMHERMDEVLRKMGAPLKAGVTPGQAWQAFATECNKGGVDCAPIFQQLKTHFVTTTKLDASGKATITTAGAATGQYYLFSQVRTVGGLMVWDVPATFAAGDNTVALTAANGEKLP